VNPDLWNPEAWLQVLQDHWVVAVIALAVIFIVLKLVKTVLKWALVIVIVLSVLAYGGYSVTDLTETLKREAISVMTTGAKDAEYREKGGGAFEITASDLKLTGEAGSDRVRVAYRGIPLGSWPMDDVIREFVERARASGS